MLGSELFETRSQHTVALYHITSETFNVVSFSRFGGFVLTAVVNDMVASCLETSHNSL